MALTKVPSNLDATIATTQSQADNSTNIATTAYVDLAVSNLSDSAPAALNTLNEIAAALGDDANYASTTTAAIAAKLPLAGGTMTGNLAITKASPKISMTSTGSGNDSELYFQTASNGRGIYLDDSDANKLKIYDGSGKGTAGEVVIDNSGQVGIGTNSPSASLDVEVSSNVFAGEFKQTNTSNGDGVHIRLGSAAAADYGLRVDSDAGNTAGFVVKADGNVGIGTFTPSHPLTIQSSHQLTDVTGMSGNTTLLIGNTGTGNGVYNALQFSGNQQSMYIASINHGTEASRRLGFFLGSAGGDAVADERLSITGNGNVGIGTDSPSADVPLTVYYSNTSQFHIGGAQAGISNNVYYNGSAYTNRNTSAGGALLQLGTAGEFAFRRATSGSSPTLNYSMYIDGSGNVGIGTTTPAKLGITGSSAGKVLELSGDDSQVRIGNSILHHDNSANTYFHIRNHYGATSALAELSLESGYISFNVGTSFAEAGRWNANGTFTANKGMIVTTNAAEVSNVGYNQYNSGAWVNGKPSQYSWLATGGGGTLRWGTNEVWVNGALSKTSGSFRIPHPLPSKTDTHDLVHSFVEAPQADNIYRGVIDLVDGTASINIDTVSGMTEGTYVLLNTNTSCFTSNETDWDAVKGSVLGNILTISCQNSSSTATVSWLVIGERHDQHMKDTNWTDENGRVIVEPLKSENEEVNLEES